MATNRNLVGPTVYNGGSYAPNRGTVNPAGYIARGVRQQAAGQAQGNVGTYGGVSTVGNDGQSDTRSGMAQQALQNRIQQNPNVNHGTPSQENKTKLTGQSLVNTLGNPTTTPLKISKVGTLKLPFNNSHARAVINARSKADQELQALTEERQQARLDYIRQQAELAKQYDTTTAANANNAAAGGLGFSSAYGNQITDTETNFRKLINELNSAENTSRTSAKQRTAMIHSAFRQQLANAAQASGYQLSGKAGSYKIKRKKKKKK